MSEPITLRGITWNHPRGLDPLLAANDVYREVAPGVRVEWTTRSLSGFGEDPLIELAASYDLLVIDHPFVGDAAASTAFHPLDTLADPDVLLERSRASVGPSHASYDYAGHQWAFAIDAAAQVSAIHERFAGDGCRRRGTTCSLLPPRFEGTAAGWQCRCGRPTSAWRHTRSATEWGSSYLPTEGSSRRAEARRCWRLLKRLCDASHPDALTWNPPTLLDQMRDGVVHYCPMLFGYSNYSRSDAPGDRVVFGDIPTATGQPTGTTLGGAGIAISTACANPEAAIAYATWITSAEVQTGLYVSAGGQPGRLEAWVDDAVNAKAATSSGERSPTMERAWVRPRIRGYQAFQKDASTMVAGLCRRPQHRGGDARRPR